ncbi:MAG: hypothetical protein FWG57_06180 [Endomicrobia bacterium]|nr:hypothetical protein [Endomicrobiia bacterium]
MAEEKNKIYVRTGKYSGYYAFKVKDERIKSAAARVSAYLQIAALLEVYAADSKLISLSSPGKYTSNNYDAQGLKRSPVVLQNLDFDNYSDKEIEALIIGEFFRMRRAKKAGLISLFMFIIVAGTFIFAAEQAHNLIGRNNFYITVLSAFAALVLFQFWSFYNIFFKVDEKVIEITSDYYSLISALEKQAEEYKIKKSADFRSQFLLKKRIARIKKAITNYESKTKK